MVSVWVKRLENIVCNAPDDGVDLEPITKSLVLLFVEMPNLFVLDVFELWEKLMTC